MLKIVEAPEELPIPRPISFCLQQCMACIGCTLFLYLSYRRRGLSERLPLDLPNSTIEVEWCKGRQNEDTQMVRLVPHRISSGFDMV